MKKILSMLFLASVVLFAGCSKDGEPEFSLKGKIYAAYAYNGGGYTVGGIYFEPYDAYSVFRFISDNEVERTTRKNNPKGGIIGELEKGTYVLNYPNLIINIEDRDKPYDCAFVDENTFRTGAGYDVLEYIKQ
jgi:hypothetical protein